MDVGKQIAPPGKILDNNTVCQPPLRVQIWREERKKSIQRAETAPPVLGVPIDCGSESFYKKNIGPTSFQLDTMAHHSTKKLSPV